MGHENTPAVVAMKRPSDASASGGVCGGVGGASAVKPLPQRGEPMPGMATCQARREAPC